MTEFADERDYAWRMIRAARRAQAVDIQTEGAHVCRDEIVHLLDAALDAGLDRVEIVVELAHLGGRFFGLCDLESTVTRGGDIDDAAICLN